MLASYNGNFETTDIIKYGAEVDKKNDRGQTPLCWCSVWRLFDTVKILVEAGANINENSGMGQTTIT